MKKILVIHFMSYCPYHPCPSTISILDLQTFSLILQEWCLYPLSLFSGSSLPALTFHSIIFWGLNCEGEAFSENLWFRMGSTGRYINWFHRMVVAPRDGMWELHPGEQGAGLHTEVTTGHSEEHCLCRWAWAMGSVNTATREEGQAGLLSAGSGCPSQLSKHPLGTLLARKGPGGTG